MATGEDRTEATIHSEYKPTEDGSQTKRAGHPQPAKFPVR